MDDEGDDDRNGCNGETFQHALSASTPARGGEKQPREDRPMHGSQKQKPPT